MKSGAGAILESATPDMKVRIASLDAISMGGPEGLSSNLNGAIDLMLASPVPMVIMWGADEVIIYNDAAIPILGSRHPEALGRPAHEVWPDGVFCDPHVIERVTVGGATIRRDQMLMVERDGVLDQSRFDLVYMPIRDLDAASTGVLCTAIEATSASRVSQTPTVERHVGSGEERLSMLVNQALIGIVECDLQGRIVIANEHFCSIVGRRKDELAACLFDDLIHPDDRGACRAVRAELLASGKAFKAEKRLVRPDGAAVWVNNHVSLARDLAGQPEFVIRVVQDISDRKEAEARARESSERVELALGAGAILGTWAWDVRDDLVTGDSRFASTFSIDPDAAQAGVPIAAALASIHPDDVADAQSAIQASLRKGGSYRTEYRLRQADGSWQWIEANGYCERDPNGDPVRFPGVLINIGQRRSAADRQAFLIALGDQLRTIDKPEAVVAKAVEMTARHLKVAFAAYGEASSDGRWLDLTPRWIDRTEPESQRCPIELLGHDAAEAMHRGETHFNAANPCDGSEGVSQAQAPVLAVPLVREGRLYATMLTADTQRGQWTEAEADLLREVVGHTWDAVERARAVAKLRRAQSRQAFLLRLNDHLSELHEPSEVMQTVAEALGSYLGVTRAGYGEVQFVEKKIAFVRDWSDGSVPPLAGSFGFEGVLDDDIAQLMRGLTVTEDDFERRHGMGDTLVAALDRSRTRAALAVPLIRESQLRAGLFLAQSEARRWSLEEISLTQEVARRTWDALERTRAEAASQRSEANLRAMFATLPVGILFAELPSGRVTEANARVEEILGYTIGLDSTDPTYGDWIAFDETGRQVDVEEHPLFIAVTTGETATRVFHHQRGDGTRVWVSIVGAPVRDAEERITGGLVTVVDIDREKRAEEALRELNATLEQQVEVRTRERDRVWRNSRDLLAVMGLDGMLYAVNPSWTALLGWPMEDLVGRRFEAFVHPVDVAPTFAAVRNLRPGELALPFENRYLCKDGSYRWFSWTASVEGDTVYANGRDVTAEKEQAQALRQAEEQLRQSQKMEAVGQLTGGIAHDFNNLLTGITGALDLLAKRIEQGRLENTRRYIDMAMTSANRAASLTHRLLAFSRRQPLEAKPVDANRLVGSMDDLLRRTLGERIELRVEVADDPWLTLCDPHQLENAVLNLVINARDAMPDGGRLSIETANAAFDTSAAQLAGVAPGAYVMVAVSDSGCGMSQSVLARAFDPFFTTKPIGQGTGLGLSMIYGFAKQSEGSVRIESHEDIGTTVRLYLPRYHGEISEVDERRVEPPRAEDGETVLIVEDDATVRNLVLEVLRELGYRAFEAEDGPSGLTILETPTHIDLLVTDVGLPGINGRQLADRARETRPHLQVLFITGYAENASFGSGQLDPGMQMITKPFAFDALATRIREMLAAR